VSAHNFVNFCLQTTSTISEVLRCWSPLWYLPSSPIRRTLCRWDVEQSPFTIIENLRWISVSDDHPCWRSPTDIFVASHWLEWSCWFAVTLLVFSWADHSTSQVLTTSHVVFLPFTEGLLQKPPYIHQTSSDWSMAVTSHAAVNARSIQIYSQNIWICR